MCPFDCTLPAKQIGLVPFCLPMPIIPPIHMDDVLAVAPELEGLPLNSVTESLSCPDMVRRLIQGLELRDALSAGHPVSPDVASSALPTTHLIVAHSAFGDASMAFPCHASVLATHFAYLPPVPAPMPQPVGLEQRQDVILPYPAAFDVLREFIYTHSLRALMCRTISIDDDFLEAMDSSRRDELAQTVALLNESTILERWSRLREVYENASRVGLVHSQFWTAIENASCTLVRAMSIREENMDRLASLA